MDICKSAFSEVSAIIKSLPDSLSKKIPESFKQIIEQEKDVMYVPELEDIISNNQLMPETVVILGMIYKKFLVTEFDFDKISEKLIERIEDMADTEEN